MLTENDKINIIREYIAGYNEYNVDKMLKHVSNNIHFMNITRDLITLNIQGKKDFRSVTEKSKSMFKKRKQEIDGVSFQNDAVEIAVKYSAFFGDGFSNQISNGKKLKLKGKSVFKFNKNEIIEIQDIIYP
ncbi:nuclear transport factor 2 family protein [Mangrovivirga cuniculi]|uniref:SnoaL-like domain-containing protein n=1 Tax=Mangrovivirga cuniculi TaxID=2715131 RepID=A0A4D7JY92_9BACT|nr:nuclear transport factor 2 family protein [Mangrovivirga cuniculi]QCK15655.1 hypothetical protein DCC35_13335 [Mangrovivirga cuniculi]